MLSREMRAAPVTALLLALAASAPAAARAGESRAVVVEHTAAGETPAEGPADALVTLELFLAPGDGVRSARAYRLVQELRGEHPDLIRVRYRLLGRSGRSDAHAEATREAHAQGLLSEYLREAYRRGRSPRRGQLKAVAERAGMDVERLEQALEDGRHADAIRLDHHARRRLRVGRVPGLLVGGAPLGEPIRSLDALDAAVAAAADRARRLVARGVPRTSLYERMLAEVALAQPTPLVGDGLVDGRPAGERREASGPPRYVGPAIDHSGGHARGPEDAPVAVVLYCHFASRYCAQMRQHTAALRGAFPDEVRLVFLHLIPEAADEPAVRRLHEAAICADEQDAFWAYYDWLYSRSAAADRDHASLVRGAEAVELDTDRFADCLREGRAAAVDEALAQAAKAGVEHTPSVVVAGRLYTGTKTFAELRALVGQELSPGIFERASALPPMF